MERTSKTWGEKYNIFQNDLCEVSILYLQPNQRCSWHTHRAKFNKFYVIGGELYIKLDNGVSKVVSSLREKDSFVTRPGEFHEFQTHDKPAIVLEIMYVKYDENDIQREIIGGPLNE